MEKIIDFIKDYKKIILIIIILINIKSKKNENSNEISESSSEQIVQSQTEFEETENNGDIWTIQNEVVEDVFTIKD